MRGWVIKIGLSGVVLVLAVFAGQGLPLKTIQADLDLPVLYDLRTLGYPFAVQDQGACEVGYAVATTEALQGSIWKQEGRILNLSANHVKECTWVEQNELTNHTCDDNRIDFSASLFSTYGAVYESCDPLQQFDGYCASECPAVIQATGWQRLAPFVVAEPEVIKQALLTYGPVITKLNKDLAGYAAYSGGVLYDPTNFTTVNHAVLIVGWDDTVVHDGGQGAWIVKDSHGTDWGENGYAYIAYGSGKIGKDSSVFTGWQDYDEKGHFYFFDEAGSISQVALSSGLQSGYMMALHTTSRAEIIQQIEFWTSDAAEVSVWIYDHFNAGVLSTLLFSKENVPIPSAGYHTILVSDTIVLDAADQVAVVIWVNNESFAYPLMGDVRSDFKDGKNWYSTDGVSWQAFQADMFPLNVGLRLRTTLPPPPSTPGGFSATTVDQSRIRLSWLGLNEVFSGYSLERFNTVSQVWVRLTSLDTATTTYTDQGLSSDTTYQYRLFSYNVGGISNPASAAGVTLPYPPPAPDEFSAVVLSPRQVALTWTIPETSISGFRIERKIDGEIWLELAVLDAASRTWIDENAPTGTAVQYRITVFNSGGESPAKTTEWIQVPEWPFKICLPLVNS